MAEAAEAFLAIEPLTWEDGQRWLGNHPINPFKPLKKRLERKAVDAMMEAVLQQVPTDISEDEDE